MTLFKKGTKLYSIWNMKCPRCHEGDMFETGSFSFKKPFEMKTRCEHCDLNFEPEPGYYYGAMFISYVWTGFFFLGIIGLFYILLDWSLMATYALLTLFIVICFVWIFRISRAMYINVNVKYQKDAIKKHLHH